jgi:hypothetical protein
VLTTPSAIFVSKRLRMSGSSHATNKCVGITVTGADRRIAQFRDPTVGPILIRLAPPCPSPPHTKPSTSWKHELPKFCGCQWRAHSPSRDGRLSTPYARAAAGGLRPLTAFRLRKRDASMRSTALPAELAASACSCAPRLDGVEAPKRSRRSAAKRQTVTPSRGGCVSAGNIGAFRRPTLTPVKASDLETAIAAHNTFGGLRVGRRKGRKRDAASQSPLRKSSRGVGQ